MKYLFILFFSTFVFSQNTTISGTITGFKNGNEVWLGDSEIGSIIKKTIIENNNFKFKNPSTDSPKELYLVLKSETQNYFFNFLIDNKNAVLTGDIADFPNNIKVKGSKSQTEKMAFEKEYCFLDKKRDSVYEQYDIKVADSLKYLKKDLDVDLLNIKKIDEQTNKIKVSNIKKNTNSLISIIHLFDKMEKFSKKEIIQFYNKLDAYHKNTQAAKAIKTHLNLKKILKEGDYYEDFQAKDSTGNLHKLSDSKGKYILLDIMQSYCYACVLSNDELKKIETKYNKNIQIVSLSIDKSKDSWMQSLKEHKPSWLCLREGNGFYGEISQKYNATGTPNFYFINPNGKIVKVIEGYDEHILENNIKELNIPEN